ncbi:MAG TPA: hypothetical protein VGJ78_11770 [Vicinamibacterales bacterium]|jgi:hypothetical protein
MEKLRTARLAITCAVAVVSAMTYVSAQRAAGPAGAPQRAPRAEQIRHLVFIATPGDNGTDNQSGVVVLDADKNYSFLKRISYGLPAAQMPGPKNAGIAVSVPLQMLYVTTDGWMKAIDLNTDQIAWTFKGETEPVERTGALGSITGCCERPWLLPDGKTLVVGSSYNSWWYYIDGVTGKVLSKLPTPETTATHNLAISPDGKIGVMGSMSNPPKAGLAIIDVPSQKILRYMTFTQMVRPLTINHDASLVYVNVNGLIGFEIGEVSTGKVLGRFEVPGAPQGTSHGIGMTPDESEIWVADPVNNAWQVWDNPGDGRHPVYNASKIMKPTAGVEHSWLTMSNDGKLAFLGDSSVYDVKTHKEIAVMKDEFGRRIVHTEKVLYLGFKDGKLVEGNNQFAVGDAKAYAARMAAGTTNNH